MFQSCKAQRISGTDVHCELSIEHQCVASGHTNWDSSTLSKADREARTVFKIIDRWLDRKLLGLRSFNRCFICRRADWIKLIDHPAPKCVFCFLYVRTQMNETTVDCPSFSSFSLLWVTHELIDAYSARSHRQFRSRREEKKWMWRSRHFFLLLLDYLQWPMAPLRQNNHPGRLPILRTLLKHHRARHPVLPRRLRPLRFDPRSRPRPTMNQEVRVKTMEETLLTGLSFRLSDWLWSIWCDMGRDRSSNWPTCRVEKNAACLSIGCRCATDVSRDQDALHLSTWECRRCHSSGIPCNLVSRIDSSSGRYSSTAESNRSVQWSVSDWQRMRFGHSCSLIDTFSPSWCRLICTRSLSLNNRCPSIIAKCFFTKFFEVKALTVFSSSW